LIYIILYILIVILNYLIKYITINLWVKAIGIVLLLFNIDSTTYNAPRRPFEKERIDNELQLVGKFGLRNKREVWRVHLTLSKFRKAARELLTL
jgi:hypothetical protein